VEPFRAAIEILRSIPGLSRLPAQAVAAEIGIGEIGIGEIGIDEIGIGEIGIDMSRFPAAANLISGAGLCPKNDEGAGKRRSARMKKGAPWLKTALIQCAWAAARTRNSCLQAQSLRLRSRRGPDKAIGAVANSPLSAACPMHKNGTLYRDPGPNYFDQQAKTNQTLRLLTRLKNLGYAVQIPPIAA
jgi:transposase